MSAAAVLAQLVAAGAQLTEEAGGLRVRAPRPLPLALLGEASQVKPALLRVASGAWRQDLDGWPAWRVELFLHLAARRLGDVPPESADVVAYLEALEALPEPSNEAAPSLPAPFDDLEELDPLEETPPGFQHRYRPPPEHRVLPPFRWSTLPPTTRRPAQPPAADPPTVIESTDEPAGGVLAPFREPPAGPEHGPRELPEHRAARFGYRIDEFGSWLEAGEASRAPRLPRFAVGREPSEAEEEARRAQLDAIEAGSIARLGPLRGTSPLPEPSPDVLPERADAWRAAYQRRLAAGLDPESAARLTITTHGPRPA